MELSIAVPRCWAKLQRPQLALRPAPRLQICCKAGPSPDAPEKLSELLGATIPKPYVNEYGVLIRSPCDLWSLTRPFITTILEQARWKIQVGLKG
jgi:hypothetical protein